MGTGKSGRNKVISEGQIARWLLALASATLSPAPRGDNKLYNALSFAPVLPLGLLIKAPKEIGSKIWLTRRPKDNFPKWLISLITEPFFQ